MVNENWFPWVAGSSLAIYTLRLFLENIKIHDKRKKIKIKTPTKFMNNLVKP